MKNHRSQSRNKRRQRKQQGQRQKHTRRHHKRQRGGYGQGAGPVGYAWTADPMTWPGVQAANGMGTDGMTMSNYLPLSPNGIAVGGVDLAVPEVGYKGGSRRHRSRRHSRRHSRRQTGHGRRTRRTAASRKHRGGFGPQELINFGRDLKFQAKTAYDAFMGNQPPVNPSPLDQPINENYKVVEPTPIDLPRAFSLAGDSVAPM